MVALSRKNGLRPMRSPCNDWLSSYDGAAFEALVADYYRACGYRVEEVGGGHSGRRFDGGIDLKMQREDEFVLVQCKHWKQHQIPHNPVHEFMAVLGNSDATRGIFIISGEYTPKVFDVIEQYRGKRSNKPLKLIDGAEARKMLEQVAQFSKRGASTQDNTSAKAPSKPTSLTGAPIVRTEYIYIRDACCADGIRARLCAGSPEKNTFSTTSALCLYRCKPAATGWIERNALPPHGFTQK